MNDDGGKRLTFNICTKLTLRCTYAILLSISEAEKSAERGKMVWLNSSHCLMSDYP